MASKAVAEVKRSGELRKLGCSVEEMKKLEPMLMFVVVDELLEVKKDGDARKGRTPSFV